MKNIFKLVFFALMAVLALTACDPQESDDYSLGTPDTVASELVKFTSAVPTSETENPLKSQNVYKFTVNPDIKVPHSVLWDLGNGVTSKERSPLGEYPFAGDYTVKLTVYSADGLATVKEEVLKIAKDDFTLLQTKKYIALTGGLDFVGGKTWVLDRTVDGHFGIGPVSAESPSWWSCPAEGKSESSLYNQEFNFSLSKAGGLALKWTNKGKIYTNEAGRKALADLGYKTSSVPPAGDFDVEYVPKSFYTFLMNEKAGTLTFSNDAFVGHYTGSSVYSILELDVNVLYLKINSVVEPGNAWWYRFVPKK